MSLRILHCKLDDIDADAATQAIMRFARDGTGAQIVTLGTEMVVAAQHDLGFREIVNNAALSLCDTIGLLLVARLRGSALRARVTGVELIEHLCASAAREGMPVYLLGSSPGIADRAAAVLRARYADLVIAGTHHGYFSAEESSAVAQRIAQSGARLLFVGLGSPRQERWISGHLAQAGCGAAIGVGGSLDVISGNVARAPKLMRKFGLEWLYRLGREPHRWRRQLALPYFVWLVLVDALRGRTTCEQ